MTNVKIEPLEWKYCECGCHGSEAGRGPVSYAINDYVDEKNKKYYLLFEGHRGGLALGRFDSYEAAKEFAFEHFVVTVRAMIGTPKLPVKDEDGWAKCV